MIFVVSTMACIIVTSSWILGVYENSTMSAIIITSIAPKITFTFLEITSDFVVVVIVLATSA